MEGLFRLVLKISVKRLLNSFDVQYSSRKCFGTVPDEDEDYEDYMNIKNMDITFVVACIEYFKTLFGRCVNEGAFKGTTSSPTVGKLLARKAYFG